MRAGEDFNLADMLDREGGWISPRVYVDEDVYRLELRRLFRRAWLYLAHETEIPNPHDFVQARMGEDPILLVRRADGALAAYLNQCRHRGARVCRAERGRAKSFTCPYHAWTYAAEDGRLAAAPEEQRAYHGELDKTQSGLVRVPRVESYKGLVFGCWDETVPDLPAYLGDAVSYLDAFVDRLQGGTEIVGRPQKWIIDCNWKLPAEQFCSDMYHVATTHHSAVSVFAPPDFDRRVQGFRGMEGIQFSDKGHGGGFALTEKPLPNVWYEPAAQQWLYDTQEQAEQRHGAILAKRFAGHTTIFPTLSFLVGTQTLRVWHPLGPGRVEVWAWCLADRAAPTDVKEAFRLGALRGFGPGGLLEQDDSDNWVEVQKVLNGEVAREGRFHLGMGRGHEFRRPDLPGVLNGIFAETAARGFYQRWRDLIEADSWDEIEARATRREHAVKARA